MSKFERITSVADGLASMADLTSLRGVTRARRFYGGAAKCRWYRESRERRRKAWDR